MKHHVRLILTFIRFNLIANFMYRGNFWSSTTADLAWAGFFITSTFFITTRVQNVGGWSKYELLLLTSTCNVLLGLVSMFVKNFYQFSNTINQGKLDSILLKPVDSQFYMSFQYINASKLPRIIISLAINVYLLNLLNISLTFLNVAIFLILMFIGFVCIYSIWYLASTLIIWYSRLSNLTELLYELVHTTRYPQEVFRELSLYFFIVLFPLTLIVSVPTRVILGKIFGGDILLLILLSIIFLSASRFFWKFALKFYTSASS